MVGVLNRAETGVGHLPRFGKPRVNLATVVGPEHEANVARPALGDAAPTGPADSAGTDDDTVSRADLDV